MNRRTLLTRFAAIAAAVVVAPAGGVEAAPQWADHVMSRGCCSLPFDHHPQWKVESDLVAEARAEGYERGRAVEAARQESRAMISEYLGEPYDPTCGQRGCPCMQDGITTSVMIGDGLPDISIVPNRINGA